MKTCDNEKGIFSCATFRDDDDILMLAAFSPNSKLSLVVKDYNSNEDFPVENIFGDAPELAFNHIGDFKLDEFGEKLLVVNLLGQYIRVYSMYDLRKKKNAAPTHQFRRGINECT